MGVWVYEWLALGYGILAIAIELLLLKPLSFYFCLILKVKLNVEAFYNKIQSQVVLKF